MRKWLALLLLFLLLPVCQAIAEAQDITGDCTFPYAPGARGQGDMRNDSWRRTQAFSTCIS
ncbi:MAG: hypothetical protein E7329_10500 [Clostridiales bacterium]|nr:hypothetical protein [Clostridiales bacterium]